MYQKLILVLITIFIASCSNDNGTKEQDCSEPIACTQNFVIIGVSVKDASGVNIPLDSFKVVDITTGKNITLVSNEEDFEGYKMDSFYPIFNDTYRIDYQNKISTIAFTGYSSDKVVVNEEFEVGADCCHVRLISGNTAIVIE